MNYTEWFFRNVYEGVQDIQLLLIIALILFVIWIAWGILCGIVSVLFANYEGSLLWKFAHRNRTRI